MYTYLSIVKYQSILAFPTDDDIKNKILGTKIFYFKNATKMVL